MMTRKKGAAKTQVRTQTTLTPLEEKVVRMRHGYQAPNDLVLEQVGQDNPDIAARIAEIEQRALAAVGARDNTKKRKIVTTVRRMDH